MKRETLSVALLVLLATATLSPASSRAFALDDYQSTLDKIHQAMDSLHSEFSNTSVACGHGDPGIFFQNNEGCGFVPATSDKSWASLGYESYAVFGRSPGEAANEYASMASYYSDSTAVYSKSISVGSHAGMVTSEIKSDGTVATFLWWGDGQVVFSLFHSKNPLDPDFQSLDDSGKQSLIDANQGLAMEYAQKLESRLLQFKAYDVTAQPEATSNSHLPIIFLPGVAGSWLYTSANSMRWINPGTHASDLFLKSDGITPVNPGVQIVAPDILRGLSSSDTLNTADPSNFYGGFLSYLQTKDYKLGKDLFVFPYDWRLDNSRHLQELDSLVDTARAQNNNAPKVILIAHSMGGIIAKAYVNTIGAAKVDTLITIGTPFYGAVKPYYALVNGYDFGNAAVTRLAMKVMAQNAPAVYQLLPRKPFITDSVTGDQLSLQDSFNIQYRGVTEGQLTYSETTGNLWQFNPALVSQADQFHSMIDTAGSAVPLPQGVKHYAIIGTGVSTLEGYRLYDAAPSDGDHYLTIGGPSPRNVILKPLFGNGDGTVPIWSAEINSVTGTYYVPYVQGSLYAKVFGGGSYYDRSSEHGKLTDNPQVKAIVASILGGDPAANSVYENPADFVTKDKTDFTLHSDANMEIVDTATGRVLGMNDQGVIDETNPSGSFVEINGLEYASLSDASKPYTVIVTGARQGEFSLTINSTSGDSHRQAVFSYPNVQVQKGTVAQFQLTPNNLISAGDIPVMQVTSSSGSQSVQPVVESITVLADSAPRSIPGAGNTAPSSQTSTSSINNIINSAASTVNNAASTVSNAASAASGNNGGRCLIATAAYGSDIAPQVQFLREFRDQRILSTAAGSSFMSVFNVWYYSFSPYVANYERSQPWMQQVVRTAIYPLLGILQLSETAYSAVPGEYGAVIAGTIASSMIGAVYVAPFLVAIKRKSISSKKLAIAISLALACVICSVISGNSLALMISTSSFVVTVLVCSALSCAASVRIVALRIVKHTRHGTE